MMLRKQLQIIDNSQEISAAITIAQKYAKGWLARKHYCFYQLPKNEQTDYLGFMVGNDPVIEGLNKYQATNSRIALIALSGMRALLLACELSDHKNKKIVPKIIVIDNSKNVRKVWDEIKQIAGTKNNQHEFLEALDCFVKANKNLLYMDIEDDELIPPCVNAGINYPKQNIIEYFKNLFNTYDFAYICAIIRSATFISQTWEDTNTFVKIKNILGLLDIKDVYVYASNILPVVPENIRMQILKNIALLEPTLTIHTDFSKQFQAPEHVYLLKDQNPEETFKILKI